MKHYLLIITMVLAGVNSAFAQDEDKFLVDGIVYQVIMESQKTAGMIPMISYPSTITYEDTYHAMDIKELVIPDEVVNPANGRSYHVIRALIYDNPSIERIKLPEGLPYIDAIKNLPKLSQLEIPSGVLTIGAISGLPINELILPDGLVEFTPPPYMGWINFRYLNNIKQLRIPHGVKELQCAIYLCDNLEKIDISSIERITDCAWELPKLKKVYFSPKLQVIYNSFLDVPSLEEIWFLSDGNEYPWDIDIRSFRGCKPKTIYCARPNAPSLYGTPSEDDMFGGLDAMKDIILYVRPECVETYRNTPNWGVMDIRPYDFQNGLPMTEADTPQNGDIKLYDLGGRPVTDANPASGIYIANGQKTVIR